jgi:hypothetical protein
MELRQRAVLSRSADLLIFSHTGGIMKRAGLIIVALGLFLSAQVVQAQWTSGKRISWNSGYSGTPAIAIDLSGGIHVVWEDDTPGNCEIYYNKSLDGGDTWSSGQRITWTTGQSTWPSLAVDSNGGIHMAWEDYTPGHYAIYYRNSTDGGATWSAVKRFTWTAGNSYNAAIAVDSSDYVHLVWNDDTPGKLELYYKKSTDGGATWTANKRLTWNSGDSGWPAIAADSFGNPHVAWSDSTSGPSEIYYRKSTDGGAAWSPAKRLTWTSEGMNIYVEMAVDSSNALHLAWHGGRPEDEEIYYKKSTDAGLTWKATKKLTLTADYYSDYPDIAADSAGNLHLVWMEETTGNREVFYKKSPDSGVTWGANQRITWTAGQTYGEAVAADSLGNVHVVWSDDTIGQAEIYYKRFDK